MYSGSNQEDLDIHPRSLRVPPQGSTATGLSIPGCSPALTLDNDFALCLDSCSLLDQYPDLQVADSGLIPHNPLRAVITQRRSHTLPNASELCVAQKELQGGPLLSVPDQGYLVMGASVNVSLDLPGSGLEPMSNSVLNGLLDKQLEEVYLQHLTENLARCSSNIGNSLLHGLVPPPQPSSEPQGLDSLQVCLEEVSGGDSDRKISYLNTQNLAPCSSNFSSPVLRISEAESTQLQ